MRINYLILTFTFLFTLVHTSFSQEHTIINHGTTVQAVAYSPINSSVVASAGGDLSIKLWDLEKGINTTLGYHTESINAIDFSPDGKTLVSGSDDFTFKLWDVENKRHITTLRHITDFSQSQIKAVAFSPDGQQIATAGLHLKFWDIHTFREITTIRHDAWIFSLAFSMDGEFLAIGDTSGEITLRNLKTRQELTEFRGDADHITSLKFSPDNQTLASAGLNRGVMLWKVSNWELIGSLPTNATVTGLSFSPDSSTLASSDFEVVNLWSVNSGENIITLKGHTDWINGASFSHDGTSLISGGDGEYLRIWDITPYHDVDNDIVRIIYFVPRDRSPQPNIWTNLDYLIRDVQMLYADQMDFGGFGRKTFTFETDESDNTIIYQVDGKFNDTVYRSNTNQRILNELETQFDMDRGLYLIVVETAYEAIEMETSCGIGGSNWYELDHQVKSHSGYAVIPASGNCFDGERGKYTAAHELGHAFGLDHDFRDDSHIMSYGESPIRFSYCATEWLSVSRYFNQDHIGFNHDSSLQILTPLTYYPNATDYAINCQISDLDSIYQVQLLIPTTDEDPATGTKLYKCKRIDAESETVEFDISFLTSNPTNTVVLQVIDIYGNITRQEYVLRADESISGQNFTDVNGDGMVDRYDLVIVAANFGDTVIGSIFPNPDVNRDGIVDIIDLLLVVNAMNIDSSAAPTLFHKDFPISGTTIQHWIDQAKQLQRPDDFINRGIEALKQILSSLLPTQTQLMTNYPNPFNPETWIPYQLASPADVIITIYDAGGNQIRTLNLGYQAVGTYYGRPNAAYWDGRNDTGESVASGLYFYTLSAGEYTATRKMLLRK